MFDLLKMVYYRVKKIDSISDAAKQFISPKVVQELQNEQTREADLLKKIADRENLYLDVLVMEVANRLGLRSVLSLDIPSAGLVIKTGFDTQVLAELSILPQLDSNSHSGYFLAVADPFVLDMESCSKSAVEIVLAPSTLIKKAWQEYFHLILSSEQIENFRNCFDAKLFSVLSRLVDDTSSCGGEEVFLGHPDCRHYEFLVGLSKYTGFIHEQIVQTLIKQLKDKSSFSLELGNPVLQCRFALTCNRDKPVVYVTWREESASLNSNSEDRKEKESNFEIVAEQSKSLQKNLVLFVDDDPRFTHLLKAVLQKNNYEVETAENGLFALEYLDKCKTCPTLIILDVHMPNMNGKQFICELSKRRLAIPILVLTSDDNPSLESDMISLGATAFVRKHEDVRILLAWCRNLTASSLKQN